jgi:gluconolactonase
MLRRDTLIFLVTLTLLLLAAKAGAGGMAINDWRHAVKPDAIVDLRTRDGAALLHATWRIHPAEIVEVDHRAAGPDLKASGDPIRTHSLSPLASAANFDDSGWEQLDPATLEGRRGTGRLSFVWYRTKLTIPKELGDLATAGTTAVLEIVADDYSEVTVDGKLPQVLGQRDGQLVSGWNAPNRVVLTRDAKASQVFTVAILVANAPLSNPPANFIWLRSASVKFYAPGKLEPSEPAKMEIVRFDPALDAVIPPDARLERIADGFGFTEGPVWVPAADDHNGYLLFSDPNNNAIHRWSPDGALSVFRSNSGYSGIDIGLYRQPGSNGLALDSQGRLTLCEHGNRRVTRLEKNGVVTVLADRYDGKRLNSPNDLVYRRSDDALFFTDPPFGLPKFHDDPRRELPHFGVYCLKSGELKLVSTDMTGPNGLAFSPNEKHLYVGDWNERAKFVRRYDVGADGTLSNPIIFADLTSERGEEAIDGVKVDAGGNVFISGPGGLWIFAPDGKKLGLLKLPQLSANFNWGDAHGGILFLTARTGVYRLQIAYRRVVGKRPA